MKLGKIDHIKDDPTQHLEDTDFYKFTMAQVYDQHLPSTIMEMKFHNRTPGVNLAKYVEPLKEKLKDLCECKISPKTISRFQSSTLFTPSYIDFLSTLKLNYDHISELKADGESISIRTKGSARYITWFETHVMSIIQELYFRDVYGDLDLNEGSNRLTEKIKKYKDLTNKYQFKFSEFGTRRRALKIWQEQVLQRLIDMNVSQFAGTSNVHFATKFDIPMIGTFAHEYLMVGQGLKNVNIYNSQFHMLNLWQEVYGGALGIALSDVFGTKAFLNDFNYTLANQYTGVRHDSGDPFTWAESHIEHYKSFGIDPKKKVLLFSDGLNVNKVEKILERFHGKINLSFGIGTDFTNDLGVPALQLVMKAVKVNNLPVAKISDSPGKGMCEDPYHEEHIRKVFKIV